MRTFEFSDGKSNKFWAIDADKQNRECLWNGEME